MAMPIMVSAQSNVFQRSAGLGDLFTLDQLFNLNGNGTTNLGDLFILDKLFPAQTTAAATTVSLATKLSGRILIQTQANGEAWYVDPTSSNERVYLGDPAMAFSIMGSKALGISNANFDSYNGKAPSNLAGRFLIKTEDHGKLYYVNPVDLSINYVSGPAGAQTLIRKFGVGITNSDLNQITVEP